jgi:aminopeptidase N
VIRLLKFFVAYFILAGSAVFAQPKNYDVTSYDATIVLNRIQNTIAGEVEMKATAMGELVQILQHAKFLRIDSIFVDGVRANFTVIDTLSGAYNITGFQKYDSGTAFSVKTYYHGKGTNEGGSNPWGGVSNMGGMMFAMGVGFSAPYVSCTRHWLPCYDEPDDKADSVTLRFIADTSGIVVSNGLKTSYLVANDGHTTTCEWKISHPIATYLLTFAYGPFEKLSIPNSLHIPFDVYSFVKDSLKLRMLMQKRIVEALAFYDSLFAKYPFEKVGYVVAPIGSMEHQTMITLVNQALDTNSTTAAHELSHMWWGDRVTCKDFNDPWLNEGFATFCESLILERFFGKTQYWNRQHSNIAGAISSGSGIPMYGAPFLTKPRNNYPYGVIYQKGASVLGMLRYILGDSVFFYAVRQYGNAYAYSTATSYDLRSSFKTATGMDLGWFFNKWVFGIGYPQLNIKWSANGGNVMITFQQTQDSAKAGYFRLPIIIEARAGGGKSERHQIVLDSVQYSVASFLNSFIPDTLVIDPDGALIKKIVSQVKLGVSADGNNREANKYSLRFNPNPANAKTLTMTLSIPDNNLMKISDMDKYQLSLYDTNGNTVRSARASFVSRSASEYESSVDIGFLPSGTYFAKLMLNNEIFGEGQFVITK